MAIQLELFPGTARFHGVPGPRLELSTYVRPEVGAPDATGRGFYDYNVGLIACSKSKIGRAAPARDFYTGPLFQKARAYCERMCLQWYVLSAEYGLVAPEQVLEPYEKTLKDASARARAEWGQKVLTQFREERGTHCVWHFVLLAGADYRESLPQEFFTLGTHSLPLKGCLGNGEQLQRLNALVAEWDSWLQPSAAARVCALPDMPGWEVALQQATFWLREQGGPWRGPMDHGKHEMRCRKQYLRSRGSAPLLDGGWTADFPSGTYRSLLKAFQKPAQQAFLAEAQVARRSRRRPPRQEAVTS